MRSSKKLKESSKFKPKISAKDIKKPESGIDSSSAISDSER